MNDELMLDLLSKKAAEGLDRDEQGQLDELLALAGAEDDSFELTAAAISMVDLKTNEPLPSHLQAKILADAERIFDAPQKTIAEPKSSFWNFNWFGNLGWVAAAVACIALGVNVWYVRNQPPQIVYVERPAPPQLSAAELREQMMAEGGDMVKASWTEGNDKDVKEISGDIVWSDAKQSGYMRFRGLPVNDPKRHTYQLWIFDETQDEKTPIDGGTFNVDGNGDVIVPIKATLKASRPKMFAITVEKPGGVVVSKRDKIAAIAKVEL